MIAIGGDRAADRLRRPTASARSGAHRARRLRAAAVRSVIGVSSSRGTIGACLDRRDAGQIALVRGDAIGSEMGVTAVGKRESAPSTPRTTGGRLALDDPADRGSPERRPRPPSSQRPPPCFGHRRQNLIVVAAGQRRSAAPASAAASAAPPGRQRHRRRLDLGAHAGASQMWAKSPTSPSEMSSALVA